MFDLAIDSKLRACDLVKLRLRDIAHVDHISARAIVLQQKTQRPVQLEITEQSREAITAWVKCAGLGPDSFLFPSRIHGSPHLSTRQYARIVGDWIAEIGLDVAAQERAQVHFPNDRFGSKAAIQNHSHITLISEGWWNVCPYFWPRAEVFALLQLF